MKSNMGLIVAVFVSFIAVSAKAENPEAAFFPRWGNWALASVNVTFNCSAYTSDLLITYTDRHQCKTTQRFSMGTKAACATQEKALRQARSTINQQKAMAICTAGSSDKYARTAADKDGKTTVTVTPTLVKPYTLVEWTVNEFGQRSEISRTEVKDYADCTAAALDQLKK